MKETLPGREQNFVRKQTDDDNDEHDADNLVHGIQFAAQFEFAGQVSLAPIRPAWLSKRHLSSRDHGK
jgi:hypothetical protein